VNCRKASNLLSSYIDGELPGVEQLQIRSHLKNCPSCGADYESLLKTKRVLATLAYRAPRLGFDDEIINFVKSESDCRKTKLDPETWWTLLTEVQRNRFRFATVASLFAVAGILWVRAPMVVQKSQATIANLPKSSAPQLTPVRFNGPEFHVILGTGPESMPISGGTDLTPAPANTRAELALRQTPLAP
jgi:predicted anti-sigma-YlaC factor YlaD